MHIQIDLAASAPRMDDKGNPVEGAAPRPAYASAGLDLNVPPLSRTLGVTATVAAEKVDPGAQTSQHSGDRPGGQPGAGCRTSRGRGGRGCAGAEQLPAGRPNHHLYTARSGTNTVYGRSTIVLANPQTMAQEMQNGTMMYRDAEAGAAGRRPTWRWKNLAAMQAAPAAAPMPTMSMAPAAAEALMMDKTETATTPIAARTDFNPLALFAPDVRTDSEWAGDRGVQAAGQPDAPSLMVVAATEKQFGAAEANLTARLPLMVRPSAPLPQLWRSFHPDRAAEPDDEPMTVDVAIDTANLAIEEQADSG